MKDVCSTHGTLPEKSILISNGVPICTECKLPLFTQAELDSDAPPVYARSERGDWQKVEAADVSAASDATPIDADPPKDKGGPLTVRLLAFIQMLQSKLKEFGDGDVYSFDDETIRLDIPGGKEESKTLYFWLDGTQQ